MLIQGNTVFENAVYNAKMFVVTKSWGKINNLQKIIICRYKGNFFRNANYSQTSPQWPPLGQRKVAVVKRWPLWGGRRVI